MIWDRHLLRARTVVARHMGEHCQGGSTAECIEYLAALGI